MVCYTITFYIFGKNAVLPPGYKNFVTFTLQGKREVSYMNVTSTYCV